MVILEKHLAFKGKHNIILWIDYIYGCIQNLMDMDLSLAHISQFQRMDHHLALHCGDMTRMAHDMYTVLPAPPTTNSSLVDRQALPAPPTVNPSLVDWQAASSTYHQL